MADEFKLPDPARVEMIVSNLLTIAKLLSGAGIGIGSVLTTMSQDKLTSYVSLGLIAIGLASGFASWLGSQWQHYRMEAAKQNAETSAAMASAQISAASGVPTPVIVAVMPADKPNIVVPVSTIDITKAEAAGATAPTEPMEEGERDRPAVG